MLNCGWEGCLGGSLGETPPGCIFILSAMYLLYLDDSGSTGNANEKYLVLGGVAVYEAQVDHITRELDSLAESICPSDPHSVEFHASEIFSRRIPPWKGMSRDDAIGIIKSVLNVLADAYDTARAFACAIHKPTAPNPNNDHMGIAFEDLCSRFDIYLRRLHRKGNRQRGLLILDQGAHETTLQQMAREFRTLGTRWGSVRNLVDTPLFVNSRASRVVQLADHVAYSVFRRYERGDTQYFDIISAKFDSTDGVVHGLSHKHHLGTPCMCLACVTRPGLRHGAVASPGS